MKTRCFRLPFLAMAFGACLSVRGAYNTFIWNGQGADNNWSTKENWVGGQKPGGWDYVVFPSGDWNVNIPVNTEYVSATFEDGAGTVTFTGEGLLKFNDGPGASFNVGEGRTVIIDGPLIRLRTYNQRGNVFVRKGGLSLEKSTNHNVDGSVRLQIEDGVFTTTNGTGYICFTNNAQFVVSGGDVSLYGEDFHSGSKFLIAGGKVFAARPWYSVHTFKSGSSGEFIGGQLRWNELGANAKMTSDQFKWLAPQRGAELTIVSALANALDLGNTQTIYSMGGETYVTNRTDSAMGTMVGGYSHLSGGGTLYVNGIDFRASQNDFTAEWDVGALYVGPGGFQSTTGRTGIDIHFRDGIRFGAFADWSFFAGLDKSFYIDLHGPLAFETRNCFGETDGETGGVRSHAITGQHVKLADVTEIKADGGGTVALTLVDKDYPEQLRSIEVAAGTTLALTNGLAKLKTMNLKLGANATLAVDLAAGGYVDAAAVAEFGEGARIVVTKLPELVAQKFYPVYIGPAKKGDGLALPTIELPELPEGWFLTTTANSAYLTDGNPVTDTTSSDNPWRWVGSETSGMFADAVNWKDGKTPGTSSAIEYLINGHTVVTNGESCSVGNFNLSSAAGPFVFRGEPFRFYYPKSGGGWEMIYYTVRNDSAFPTVLENDIGVSTDKSLGFRMQAYKEGSVALLGDSLDAPIPLLFGGDVRLGGTWQASRVDCSPNYGSAKVSRRSRLTVMPGATLSISDQDGEQFGNAYYAIAQGGTMTVDGSAFLFTTNASTHFIDGTLTVNAPFGATARQTFRGDGTLKLLGGVLDDADSTGGVRVEGNLTLVPSDWTAKLALSVKGNVTIAPVSDWAFGSSSDLELEDHAKLTFATGGHVLTLGKPIVSDGEVEVTGSGKLVLAAAGTSLWKVTCADGAAVGATDELLAAATDEKGFADILRVRKPDDSLVFADDLKTKMRYEVETDSTVYSAKRKYGLMLLVR